MQRDRQTVSVSGRIVLLLVLFNAVVAEHGLVLNGAWYKLLYVTLPLLLLSILVFRKNIL